MIDDEKLIQKNQEVEDALYKTATGYYMYDEEELYAAKVDEKGKKVLDAFGNPILELSGKKRKKKWYAGGFMAQKMWLEKKDKDNWGDHSKEERQNNIDKVLSVLANSVEAWDDDNGTQDI